MKRLCLRVLVSLLTLFIGIAAGRISLDKKSSPSLTLPSECQPSPTIKRETPSTAKVAFEKIGDLPAIGGYEFNRIQFVNELDGWFTDDKSLWRTQDGGKSWKLVFDGGIEKACDTCNEGSRNSIKKFQFTNSRVGWVLMRTHMFKTEDGGISWQPFAESLVSKFNGDLTTFRFLSDEKHGWIAGGAYRTLKHGERVTNIYSGPENEGEFGVIFSTEDGGQTWRKQLLESCGIVDDLFILDEKHGWAVGAVGAYYLQNGRWKKTITDAMSEDGVEVLTECLLVEIGSPPFYPISSYFVNAKLGWINNKDGSLGKTKDGGKTWKDQVNFQDYVVTTPSQLSLFPKTIYFSDASNGWALDRFGAVRQTFDGGATWPRFETDIKFEGMFFLDAQHGWFISENALFRFNPNAFL